MSWILILVRIRPTALLIGALISCFAFWDSCAEHLFFGQLVPVSSQLAVTVDEVYYLIFDSAYLLVHSEVCLPTRKLVELDAFSLQIIELLKREPPRFVIFWEFEFLQLFLLFVGRLLYLWLEFETWRRWIAQFTGQYFINRW